MKYVVPVEYKLTRHLTVHAATPEEARRKAERVVSGWAGAESINALSATPAEEAKK